MVKIRKYANIIEKFLHGEKGQRFFNFAYSVGAAIVIWGALFKILHLPGGNVLLCVGMGTEIAMFILTAFDRPPKDYNWEEVFPALDNKNSENGENNGPVFIKGAQIISDTHHSSDSHSEIQVLPEAQIIKFNQSISRIEAATKELENIAELTETTSQFMASLRSISENMINLNKNLEGLNTIYGIQLKSISGQLDTIDKVNEGLKDMKDMFEKSAHESSRYCEESEKMTRLLMQINSVYEKMISALTVNMQINQNPFSGTTEHS